MRQWAGLSFRYPLDERQLEEHLGSAGRTRMIFTAVELETGETVGHAELDRIDPGRSAHVCRVIVDPDRRGRGIGTAVMDELCRIAFEDLGVARLTLNVYEWNAAAIASYEKLGFRTGAVGTETGGDWAYHSMELERESPHGRPSFE